ncbi:MAG: hypothetical protein CMJ34_11755 [Phycisphaerae bacterium]|nr:hypothetical protein [Phycisphaerae bacterium]
MRTIWSTLSFLAVVNMLAILLAVGWLYQSGRIDTDRLERVRELFGSTIADERAAREAAAAREAELAAAVPDDPTLRWGSMPLTNLAPADAAERIRDLGDEIAMGLGRDADAINARIEANYRARKDEIDLREQALDAREARFEQIAKRSGDAEFVQTVTDLEEMKLDTAFSIIQAWYDGDRRHLVVDVLAGMGSQRRSEILGEFVDQGKTDVAAILQLALRDRTAIAVTGTEALDAKPDDEQASSRRNGADPLSRGINTPVDA